MEEAEYRKHDVSNRSHKDKNLIYQAVAVMRPSTGPFPVCGLYHAHDELRIKAHVVHFPCSCNHRNLMNLTLTTMETHLTDCQLETGKKIAPTLAVEYLLDLVDYYNSMSPFFSIARMAHLCSERFDIQAEMSIVPKETIEVIAQSIGISNMSADAALELAPDVEYRTREIMQPIYGFASGGPLCFRKAIGHKDLFYLEDKDIDIKDVIDAPLPKAPLDTAVLCHWLVIEGVQPAIPENAPVQVTYAPSGGKIQEQRDDNLPLDIKLLVRHVLSRELQACSLLYDRLISHPPAVPHVVISVFLQLYFEKITELTIRASPYNPPDSFDKAISQCILESESFTPNTLWCHSRFAFLYCQTSRNMFGSMNQICFLNNRKIRSRDAKLGKFYRALLRACGQFIHNRLKILPPATSAFLGGDLF
ncbi:hypothetical protein SAY87_017542 [Trapa incisa]|uniref:TATA box binding protein associated factor (TAF) histone-like fold domain-containing protein n=1 Tax=Trapa incisa TaxID=236973 RepID=A0AAN7L950_9MYRT|nr:hypothetical protein SAY87_017542 [Trapa incisa]